MSRNGREISIKIGSSERHLKDARESWINQQINLRRKDRQPVCVRVTIHDSFVDMILSTADCPNLGGGGRLPNRQEKIIFDLWKKLGLNKSDFHGGNLVAFLKQVS